MLSSISRPINTRPDVLVIGGGPGGYVASIRAAQLGLKTICVEKESLLGGTCLREGCIPSKYLINIAHKVYEANNNFSSLGISIRNPPTINLASIMKRKVGIIRGLSNGINSLFKKYGAELISGFASIKSFKNGNIDIEISSSSGKVSIQPKNLILATGSKVSYPSIFPVNEKTVVTSKGALSFTSVPKRLAIIGAGVIGLELGSAWSALGSQVTIIDSMPQICGGFDSDASLTLTRILKSRGLDFKLGHPVQSLKIIGKTAEVVVGGEKIECDKCLVAVGRIPNTKGYGLEKLGVKMVNGAVWVDKQQKTSVSHIYAIGDLIPGKQLAHKAEEEGLIAAEAIAGKNPTPINNNLIPSVIYTFPEMATVGISEKEARKNGKVKVSKFPYMANSRARAVRETSGFVKWICSEEGHILGMTIVGPNAGDAIMEGTIAMKNKLNIRQIAETCHPHPTFSEAILEAAKGVLGKPIHI